MEAKELRIGNFITSKSSSTYWEVNVDDLKHIEDNPDHYEPIPLTEEWLLKFGFEKSDSDYQIQIQKDDKKGNTDYWIYVDSGFDNETNKFKVQILCQEGCWLSLKTEYVHQLQNLYFALTGEELILKQ